MNGVSIIGGAGFIGTRLCRLLAGKRDIRVLDVRPPEGDHAMWHKADVRDRDSLAAGFLPGSIVVNLAAEHRDDVRPLSLYDQVNVDGARNCCAAATETGVDTIVFTSSVAVYGFSKDPIDESAPLRPFNDYGRTKREAEEVYLAWQRERPQERTLVIIRPTVVFGEGNKGNVYNLLRQINSGLFMMIGSGRNRKSMAYVENVAAFIEKTLSSPRGVHIYNYVDKPDFDMNTLVDIVRTSLGKKRASVRLPVPVAMGIGLVFDGFARLTRRPLPISRIRIRKFVSDSVYGTRISSDVFVPPVPLQEALERTIASEFSTTR